MSTQSQTFEPLVISRDSGDIYKWDTLLGRYVTWSEVGALKVTVATLIRRVEKLEQEWRVAERRKDGGVTFMHSRMTELADAMNEAGLAVGDHSRHAQMEERLKKLEERIVGQEKLKDYNSEGAPLTTALNKKFEYEVRKDAMLNGRPLIDHEVAGRQMGRIMRQKAVSHTEDYTTAFDPDASPSGVPFEVALMYLRAGRRVRRAEWRKDIFLRRELGMRGRLITSNEDVFANDWMVLPKEKGE